MTPFKTLLAAVCAAGLAAGANAATIVNGSFEDIGSGTLNGNGWNIFSSVPGWDGQSNIEIQSAPTLGSIDAQHGNHYAELDSNHDSRIVQQVALDAGSYSLSFWYSPRVHDFGTTTNNMGFSVAGATETFVSTVINGAPNDLFPHGMWTQVISNFTINTAETVALSFEALGGSHYAGCGNCGALIDNVSIAPVPLPAGLLLLLTGLGAFAFFQRRSTD